MLRVGKRPHRGPALASNHPHLRGGSRRLTSGPSFATTWIAVPAARPRRPPWPGSARRCGRPCRWGSGTAAASCRERCRRPRRDDFCAHPKALRGEDVALLAVRVVEQRDAGRPIRVVLDARLRGNPVLAALEVDPPVAALGASAAMARGGPARGVRPPEDFLPLVSLFVGSAPGAPPGSGRCRSACRGWSVWSCGSPLSGQPSTAAPSNSSMRSPGASWTIAFFQERDRPLCSPRRFGLDFTFEVRTAFTWTSKISSTAWAI